MKKNDLLNISSLKIILAVVFLSITNLTNAQPHTVSPLIIEETVAPRDIFQQDIKITNLAEHKIRVYPTVNEIVIGEGNEIKEFITPVMSDRTTTPTSWIEVNRGRVEINPRETVKVPVTFKIHPDAVPGKYYVFLGFPNSANRPEAEARVMNGLSEGVIVRLDIPDKNKELLRLEKFTAERFVYNDEGKSISITLANTGDGPTTPKGEIIFYDQRGNEVSSLAFNTESQAVEPGKESVFSLPIPDDLKIGKHKALLNLTYGANQTATIYDTTFFTVVPIVWLLSIFGSLLLTTILLALKYHKSLQRRDQIASGDGEVQMYVRQHQTRNETEHDIKLK